jgi:SUMO ligase MMS21 Smc5/6 complex component
VDRPVFFLQQRANALTVFGSQRMTQFEKFLQRFASLCSQLLLVQISEVRMTQNFIIVVAMPYIC